MIGGRRTALPRQQTLQALIDWSWNLLDEQEQTLLRRLSVFSGGWTLDAAQAVASDNDFSEFDIIDLLDQLINKSPVTWMIAMASFLSGRVEASFENWSEAEVSFTKAAALFESVRDQRFAEISRSQAAHMKRRSGGLTGAEEMYLRTLVDFYEIGHTSAVAHQLECLGFIAESQREYIRAARLLGAAQALREAIDSTRLPQEQVEFDQALAHLAEAIGETAVSISYPEIFSFETSNMLVDFACALGRLLLAQLVEKALEGAFFLLKLRGIGVRAGYAGR